MHGMMRVRGEAKSLRTFPLQKIVGIVTNVYTPIRAYQMDSLEREG